MDVQQLNDGDRKVVAAEETKVSEGSSDLAIKADGQGHPPTQTSHDGQSHPPDHLAHAGPIVVPSPLDECHHYILYLAPTLTPTTG